MIRVLITTIFMGLAAAAGFWTPRIAQLLPEEEIRLDDPSLDMAGDGAMAPESVYSCKTIVESVAQELGSSGVANYRAGPERAYLGVADIGPVSTTFRIASDGKGIFIATAAKLMAGPNDFGDAIPIVTHEGDTVVASGLDELHAVETLSVNAKTLKAVLSETGRTDAGAKSRAVLLACRQARTPE